MYTYHRSCHMFTVYPASKVTLVTVIPNLYCFTSSNVVFGDVLSPLFSPHTTGARQPGDDRKPLFLESIVCCLSVTPVLPLHSSVVFGDVLSSLFKVTTRNPYLASLESVVCHAGPVRSASQGLSATFTSSSVVWRRPVFSLSFPYSWS